LAKVIEVIREEWVKLDPRVQKMLNDKKNKKVIGTNLSLKKWFIEQFKMTNKSYSIWHKTLDTDEDVKRYLGYCVREYVVDKDMKKLPKKEQFETFEFI
jgi:hypothetical protein